MEENPSKWCFVTVTTVLSYNKVKTLKGYKHNMSRFFNSMASLTAIVKSLVTFRFLYEGTAAATAAHYAAERFDLMESSRN